MIFSSFSMIISDDFEVICREDVKQLSDRPLRLLYSALLHPNCVTDYVLKLVGSIPVFEHCRRFRPTSRARSKQVRIPTHLEGKFSQKKSQLIANDGFTQCCLLSAVTITEHTYGSHAAHHRECDRGDSPPLIQEISAQILRSQGIPAV